MNGFRTFILMLALTMLFLWIGQMLGGKQGLVVAITFAFFTNFIAYWFSDKIVLLMYGAKETKEADLPAVYDIVGKLTKKANLPMPKIYIMENPTPNAFATGRSPKNAAVAVTTGIIKLLNEEELEGVIAHELSHIKNRDTLIAVIAATVAGAIFMLARMAQFAAIFGGSNSRDRENGGGGLGLLVVMIVAPICAMLLQLAISRTREYIADESAGRATGNPLALANALKKLTHGVNDRPLNANPTTAHLFIVNPFKEGSGRNVLSFFSTHPPVSERIRRLENLATKLSGYNVPNIIY